MWMWMEVFNLVCFEIIKKWCCVFANLLFSFNHFRRAVLFALHIHNIMFIIHQIKSVSNFINKQKPDEKRLIRIWLTCATHCWWVKRIIWKTNISQTSILFTKWIRKWGKKSDLRLYTKIYTKTIIENLWQKEHLSWLLSSMQNQRRKSRPHLHTFSMFCFFCSHFEFVSIIIPSFIICSRLLLSPHPLHIYFQMQFSQSRWRNRQRWRSFSFRLVLIYVTFIMFLHPSETDLFRLARSCSLFKYENNFIEWCCGERPFYIHINLYGRDSTVSMEFSNVFCSS